MGYENKETEKLSVSIGSRTYSFNIKISKAGKRYLEITESKQITKDSFERRSMVIFEGGFEMFATALNKVIKNAEVKEVDLIRMAETKPIYENAYKPWTSGDDFRLEQLYHEGKNIEELMTIFKRNRKE